MLGRSARHIAYVVLVAALLTGCGNAGGGSGEESRPTPSATLDLPSPTRSRTSTNDAQPSLPTPTRDTPNASAPVPDRTRDTAQSKPEEPTRQPEKTDAQQPVQKPSQQPAAGPTTSSSTSTTTLTTTSTTTSTTGDNGSGGTPAWVWLLLAVVIFGALAGGTVVWFRPRRKHRWLTDLRAAGEEVEWFAHGLLPELRRSTSLDQVVGGWNVASTRVEAAEDRLTILESSAPSEAEGSRARALRDDVRLAAQRLDALAVVAAHDTWVLELDAVAADLEAALGIPKPTPDRPR